MSLLKNILLLLLLFSPRLSHSQSRAIDSLQKIIDEGKIDLETNFALNNIAIEYTRTDMGKAKTYLHQAMAVANSLKNDVTLSNSYSQMITLQMNMGKKDSAVYYLQLLKKLSDGGSVKIKSSYNLAAGL
ncbi:MAG: hypothetical protein ABIU77_26205, partial [Ferruginibacter sp.]